MDESHWRQLLQPLSLQARQQIAGQWEPLRTDLYAQAQGVITPDYRSYSGLAWYHTDLNLEPAQTQGSLHLRFPGVFNDAVLYVNGEPVAYRRLSNPQWWANDYRFEWDVDLAGRLKPGVNRFFLHIDNPNHFGGIFRRPFLYREVAK